MASTSACRPSSAFTLNDSSDQLPSNCLRTAVVEFGPSSMRSVGSVR